MSSAQSWGTGFNPPSSHGARHAHSSASGLFLAAVITLTCACLSAAAGALSPLSGRGPCQCQAGIQDLCSSAPIPPSPGVTGEQDGGSRGEQRDTETRVWASLGAGQGQGCHSVPKGWCQSSTGCGRAMASNHLLLQATRTRSSNPAPEWSAPTCPGSVSWSVTAVWSETPSQPVSVRGHFTPVCPRSRVAPRCPTVFTGAF